MSLKDIISKCSALNIYEERQVTDERGELVFYSKDSDAWYKVFSEIFGPPAKPAGVEPTKDDLYLTKDCGGIFANQILFKKDFDGTTGIAMFWPWQDKEHTTLKIAFTSTNHNR